MNIFYIENKKEDNIVVLPEKESKHLIKVLRYQINDIVNLVDGKGTFYEAKIINNHSKKCHLEIIHKRIEKAKKFYLHIAIAPIKMNDRMEWFVEKVTELGIDEITPIFCYNSERKKIKNDRLKLKSIAAMKQSLKATLPKINYAQSFKDILKVKFSGQKFIAHCYDLHRVALKELYIPQKNVLILIGPEGDFSKEEVALAIQNGFEPIKLGNSRLRTETAGIAACHTINLMNE